MRSDKFGFQLDWKSKTWFFTFLNAYVFEYNGIKFWSHSFHLLFPGILQTRMDQRGDHTKMNFNIFQIQKWISQTVRAQEVHEKMESFV